MLRRIRVVLIVLAVVVGLQPAAFTQASTYPEVSVDTRSTDESSTDESSTSESATDDGPTDVARARVATEVLLDSYDEEKAWFPSSWWNSAVALQTIGDYVERTGDEIYGNFTSRAIDDAGWWALNWVTAYDLTGDRKYLDMAVTIADFMHGFWDPSTCEASGGTRSGCTRTPSPTASGSALTAELHNRIPGDTAWPERSQAAWDWYAASGLINSSGLVNDGLTDSCANNGDTVWSYSQCLGIGAALELYRATGDPELLGSARRLADAALTPGALVTDRVLTEDEPIRDGSNRADHTLDLTPTWAGQGGLPPRDRRLPRGRLGWRGLSRLGVVRDALSVARTGWVNRCGEGRMGA